MWQDGKRTGRCRRAAVRLVFLYLFFSILCFSSLLYAQGDSRLGPGQPLSYEERLRFYLNATTKEFLVDMAAKELLLLQMIENLTAEIKDRGVAGFVRDDPGFSKLYRNSQEMVSSYQLELKRILATVDEIDSLSATLRPQTSETITEQLADLKAQLVAAIEHRNLSKKALSQQEYARELSRAYGTEIDALLQMYRRLEKFERSAESRNDTTALRLVATQKDVITSLMSAAGTSEEADQELTDAYMREAENIIAVLSSLEELEKESQSVETVLEVEAVRRNLLAQLDTRFVELLGDAAAGRPRYPTITEIFTAWRSERIADHNTRLTEYSIIKTNLLASGGDAERRRMLKRDLTKALTNYAAERYRTAELQFDALLDVYGTYFENSGPVIFYRAESFYGRAIYQQAVAGYEQIIKEYPSSKYYPLSLLRLVSIAYTLKQPQLFFTYYQVMDSEAGTLDQRIVDRARYLCGYYQLQLDDDVAADNTLAQIHKNSMYSPPAAFLRGVAKARQGNTDAALQYFKELAETESMPWSDATMATLRNSARLRIGFIHYQRGDLDNAIKYFDSVSRGTLDYDQSLLGRAWANVKKGNYLTTISQVSELLQDYLWSNYTYEALVLSAHCRRLLDQPEAALDELRYVTEARGALELSSAYHEERRQIVRQMSELERLEETILDRRDRPLYDLIAEVRLKLQAALGKLNGRGGASSTLMAELANERTQIYKQIQELDYLIARAQELGREDAAAAAIRQSHRLMTALQTYQTRSSVSTVNHFIDYPLAGKEGGAIYRRQILANVSREIEAEQTRIRETLAATQELANGLPKDRSESIDVEIMQDDLKNLQHRTDRFHTWVATHEVEEVQTDFNRWADFSGFGMSDINMQELLKLDREISECSQHLAAVDVLLHTRQQVQTRSGSAEHEQSRLAVEKSAEPAPAKQQELQEDFEKRFFDHSTFEAGDSDEKPRTGSEEKKVP